MKTKAELARANDLFREERYLIVITESLTMEYYAGRQICRRPLGRQWDLVARAPSLREPSLVFESWIDEEQAQVGCSRGCHSRRVWPVPSGVCSQRRKTSKPL